MWEVAMCGSLCSAVLRRVASSHSQLPQAQLLCWEQVRAGVCCKQHKMEKRKQTGNKPLVLPVSTIMLQ